MQASASLPSSPAFAAPSKYKATVIDVPGGFRFGFGHGINNAGQVVGSYRTHVDFSGAFLYSDGSLHDLGTLGGTSATAADINRSGQITGSIRPLAGGNFAYLYSDGVVEDLGNIGGRSFGNALNDAGEVTGVTGPVTEPNGHAFLYSGGVMQTLRLSPNVVGCTLFAEGFFEGNDINNFGQVTGTALVLTPNGCEQRPVVYSGGQTVVIETFLESLGIAINDSGQVAISAHTPEGNRGDGKIRPA